MAGIPPPPAPPPAKKGARGNPYDNYILAHPGLKPWAQAIRQSAVAEGLDPVYWAAVIWLESKGDPKAVSSAGALGLAQVMPLHVGEYAPWLGRRITRGDLDNPGTNLRFGAYIFSKALASHGMNYDQAYRGKGGYNPGYTGPSPFATVPKTYVPSGSTSPTGAAQNAQERATARQTLGDPWVVIRNGKLRYVNSTTPPKGALTAAGLPLTRSQFLTAWHDLNPTYEAYTGRVATAAQAAQVLRQGTSVYHLQLTLSQTPQFQNSPVWKSRAPDYIAAWKATYGNNSKPDRALIGQAIVQNLSGTGFHELLRERTDYVQSSEFKQTALTMQGVYENIYGAADENAGNVIKQAALSGWSPDQFSAYLQHLPEYKNSHAYQSSQLNLLDALGLITGHVATLQPGQPAAGSPTGNDAGPGGYTYPVAPAGAPGLPNDPRVPRPHSPTPAGGMVATV